MRNKLKLIHGEQHRNSISLVEAVAQSYPIFNIGNQVFPFITCNKTVSDKDFVTDIDYNFIHAYISIKENAL